ncbi:MAG: NYN domain-containing protein, partial [Thermoguttaceae bacterium]
NPCQTIVLHLILDSTPLKKLRKVALRLGYINERSGGWLIRSEKVKDLLSKRITIDKLTEADVYYDIKQKGVDMRIGLDIASVSYKKQVDQIVLVAGDSDFVPAAKLARREGIDFILDPMWSDIRADLQEHVDGLKSVLPLKRKKKCTDATTNTPIQSGPQK